jgi:hypothetical protein
MSAQLQDLALIYISCEFIIEFEKNLWHMLKCDLIGSKCVIRLNNLRLNLYSKVCDKFCKKYLFIYIFKDEIHVELVIN